MIAAALPPSIDQCVLRSALERAIAKPCIPKEMLKRLLDQIRDYEGFRRALSSLDDPALNPALKGRLSKLAARRISEMRRQADEYGKLARHREPAIMLTYFRILRAWEQAGGSLRISTPHYRKESQSPARPPTGPVIKYLQVAALVVCGRELRPSTAKNDVLKYKDYWTIRNERFDGHGGLTIDARVIGPSGTKVDRSDFEHK
jgi:hypothetical protein